MLINPSHSTFKATSQICKFAASVRDMPKHGSNTLRKNCKNAAGHLRSVPCSNLKDISVFPPWAWPLGLLSLYDWDRRRKKVEIFPKRGREG